MIPTVVEQHASEAAFLWRLRDAAVNDPHYDLDDLAKLDERVEAHLDGLRLAGDTAWEICASALGDDPVGEVFVAAVVAADSGDLGRVASILDLLERGGVDPSGVEVARARRAIVSALGWLELDALQRILPGLLAQTSPAVLRLLGVGACAAHRSDPGPHLEQALYSSDPRLVARALEAVGELGRVNLQNEVRRHLGSDDASARFAAAWTLTLFGDRDAADALAGIAEMGGARASAAARLALRRLDPRSAAAWVQRTAESPSGRRRALIGAGASGDPGMIPFVLACMETPALARIAGEAFTLVTGADLARDGLRGAPPEGFEVGPNDDPADENVTPDPDQSLPWPDLAKVSAWWSKHRGAFAVGSRHLLGKPIEQASLDSVLRSGYQRQRYAAALELALSSRGAPFEVRAPAFRQLKTLHRRVP